MYCRNWSTDFPDDQEFQSGIEAWPLRYTSVKSYVKDYLSTKLQTSGQSAPDSPEFDIHFLVIDSQVRHEFRFDHSFTKAAQRRIIYRDGFREASEQSDRTWYFIPKAATKAKFLTIKVARERLQVTTSWWLEWWGIGMGLGVDSPSYKHYMS